MATRDLWSVTPVVAGIRQVLKFCIVPFSIHVYLQRIAPRSEEADLDFVAALHELDASTDCYQVNRILIQSMRSRPVMGTT